MKKLIFIILLFGIFGTIETSFAATAFYVSPDGSDANGGMIDTPFRTIEKARDAVRAIASNMSEDITVYLRGGTYELANTLTFDQRDSGTNGFSVIYENYPSESPVVSGGRHVYGWVQDGDTWKVQLDQNTPQFRQLYVNGVRAVRARSGNLAPSDFTKTASGFTITNSTMQNWGNIQDIELVSNRLWKQYRCGVQSISGTALTVKQPCWNNSQSHTNFSMDNVLWIENAYELLDAPGEWYFDRVTGWLYYKPQPGENMQTAQVTIPIVETLLSGSGTLDSPLHDVHFQGISFAYSGWTQPNDNDGFADLQANFHMLGTGGFSGPWTKIVSAVDFGNARSVVFERDVFTHLGAAGLNFGSGSQNNSIIGNHLYDISGNGLMVGEANNAFTTDQREIPKNNRIANNYIHAIAAEYAGGVGIWVGYTQGSVIEQNELHDLPYTGISIGWGWSSAVSISKDNIVRNNLIYDHVQTQVDGGGIYSLSAQPGNVISGNVIKGQVNEYGALYLDNSSRYITVENNIVFGNIRSAIIKGGDHLIHDNWWQDRYTNDIWFVAAAVCVPISCGPSSVSNNHVISNISEAPTAILNAAGIESAFVNIKNTTLVDDYVAPVVSSFSIPSTSKSLTVPVTTLTAADNLGVIGYLLTESSIPPDVNDTGWSRTSPTAYLFSSGGAKTLYAWAKDTSGNISAGFSALVTVTPEYSVGGTVYGLNGMVTLQNKSGDALTISAAGPFTFPVSIPDGSTYEVTVLTQPNSQICVVSNGSGTISSAPVSGVSVGCAESAEPVLSGGSPGGELSASTSQVTVGVVTDSDAVCRYATHSGTAYDSMPYVFTSTGTTIHSFVIGNVSDGTSYQYFIRCRNEKNKSNSNDYIVAFSVREKVRDDPPSPRSLSDSKKVVHKGDTLIQKGKSFPKNSLVAVYFSKANGDYYAPQTVKTSSSGSFTLTYRVNKPTGKYGWYAVDGRTGKKSKITYYTVK